jgi:uncharacterized protein YacL
VQYLFVRQILPGIFYRAQDLIHLPFAKTFNPVKYYYFVGSNCKASFMKIVSFFSRFAIICNIAFLLFIFFSKLEAQKPVTQGRDTVVAVPFFKDLIITLGVSAIIINLIMCIVYSVIVVLGRQRILPQWLAVINFLFLIFQGWYFFFRKA